MMKLYAKTFELTESSISARSIRHLRLVAFGSLPFLPLVILMILFGMPKGYSAIPFLVLLILSAILLFVVLTSRIVNRVWSPDKYLDEWEIALKRRSMTLAFMVTMYVALFLAIISYVGLEYLPSEASDNPRAGLFTIFSVVVGVGLYSQVFSQLSFIEPMDEDELEKDKYIKTSSRGILGVIALVLLLLVAGAFILGYYDGHKAHDVEHEIAQNLCGEAKLKSHKEVDGSIEIKCEGAEQIIKLDPKTLTRR